MTSAPNIFPYLDLIYFLIIDYYLSACLYLILQALKPAAATLTSICADRRGQRPDPGKFPPGLRGFSRSAHPGAHARDSRLQRQRGRHPRHPPDGAPPPQHQL